jgi:nitrate reductase NapAB chaperone NapD
MKKSIIVLIVEHKDDDAIVDKIANRVWNLDGVAHTVEAKLIYQENKGKHLSEKP